MGDDSYAAALREQIAQAVNDVRETTPLAQSFTNFVTMNLVANAQLAAGGTAAMSFLPDDVIDTAEIAGSNYINVGTLLPFFKDALPEIAYKLHKNGKTWVLDPVAAGIGKTRTAILESFRTYPPTIVRGNASEIIALDAMWGLAQHDSTVPGTRPAGVEAVAQGKTKKRPAREKAGRVLFGILSFPAGRCTGGSNSRAYPGAADGCPSPQCPCWRYTGCGRSS